MARTVKDHGLDARAARLRLAPSKQPYWREISQGAHIGYYRGKRVGKWVARFRPLRTSGAYRQTTIGVADDVEDADGESILDFRTAQVAAREWFDRIARGANERRKIYTVGDALDDYMATFSGKSVPSTRARVEAIVRPTFGEFDLEALTQQQIAGSHRDRANSPAKLRTSQFTTELNTRPVVTDEERRRRRSTANRGLTVLKAALKHPLGKGVPLLTTLGGASGRSAVSMRPR